MSLILCSKNSKPAYDLVLPQVENNKHYSAVCTFNLTLEISIFIRHLILQIMLIMLLGTNYAFSYQLCSKLCRHNWENPSSAIKTTCTLLTTCSFLLTPLLYNSTALKNHLRCELHFHYQASRGICTHDIQVWTLNSLWLGKYGLKRFIVAKRRNFFTLVGNFEGLLSAMELEQSSKETLEYMAHLT